ncbi:MAG: acyl carrier protein [Egibacteraceae bacterium]
MTAPLSIGVEEEFLVVDPVTRAVVTDSQPVFDHLADQGGLSDEDFYDRELQLSMVEIHTRVCHSLADLRAELRHLRANLVRASGGAGRWIVAAGTLPLADWRSQRITPTPRYEAMVRTHQQVAREQIVCGCHVHVGISDADAAVQVLNRARLWAPVLLALSASSPFWMGADTGYASYRSVLWGRWPTAGAPDPHRSVAEYHAVTQSLVGAGVILDARQIYWDIRLGLQHDTLEFRIADVCPTIDEAVLQAGLCRALARTCLDEARSERRLPEARPELLRAARWRAARSGLDENLVDVHAGESVPAPVLLDRFLTYLRPTLEDTGDWDEVAALAEQTLRRGNSARRQRQTFARSQRLQDVVDLLVAETASAYSATEPSRRVLMGVEERVKEIIVRQLNPDEDRITRQARFIEDLNADPQDVTALLSQFEVAFEITISGSELEKIETVGQAIEYIETHTRP